MRDPELLCYLSIAVAATVAVTGTLVLAGQPMITTPGEPIEGVAAAAHQALFHVVSVQTTTGFCTGDFDRWPFVAKAILVTLMFVGASAGSAGGGIKVIRCLVAAKVLWAEIEAVFRPHVVRPVRVGGRSVDPGARTATLVYILLVLAVFFAGTVLLMRFEAGRPISITTAATACAATLNNIGPGLGGVGPTQNYHWFSRPSKLLMCLLMPLGRLELYAFLVLMVPSFWREE